ncbi:major facilitator superfamily domain-containing protein [Halteromyces radiatus]|uniref:major facilitator superfamily domain-containing protein n=1 Tax=Halteromyces radiatus TaxID=101107 RepID=UPI002220341B|nr:major facilitator superfamily domain-containing protein [Halteromyces radiatus]KAI8088705.1 major facilitator superfamily domain-containing protein [Halteromyces radiatus]
MDENTYNKDINKTVVNLTPTEEVVTTSSTSSSNENGEAETTSTHHATTDKNSYHKPYHHFMKRLWNRVLLFLQTHMAFKPPVPDDPRLFSIKKKRLILACLAMGSSLNGLCSTIFLPGLPDIETELKASPMAITLTTSLFILFGGIGPIMWGSMSDFYHIRRFLYLISLLVFTVASTGCALVSNVWALVVLRCIQSVGTSVTMSVGAGTVSDCWEVTERGAAFSILFVGQFFGPLVGPIIGGGLTTLLGWRSTFWFCVAYGMFLFCFLFMFLPETYRLDQDWRLPAIEEKQVAPPIERLSTYPSDVTHVNNKVLENKQYPFLQSASSSSDYSLNTSESVKTPRRDSLSSTIAHGGHTQYDDGDLERNINNSDVAYYQENPSSPSPTPTSQSTGFNPVRSVLLLRHMFVWMIAVQTGICFGTMFTIETIIPDLYATYYGFESWQTGLSFLGAGLGNIVGSFISGAISDYLLKRARTKRGGKPLTEDRLTMNAWPGGFILVPLGVLIFGWGIQAGFVVWVSIVGFGIVCFGMSQVYAAGSAYLVDSIPGKGASVTAAANLLRMTMAGILSLIARPTVQSIGTGFFMVILAGLNIMGMISFALVKWKGQTLRRRAGFGDNSQ